jgi:hypothetical protein
LVTVDSTDSEFHFKMESTERAAAIVAICGGAGAGVADAAGKAGWARAVEMETQPISTAAKVFQRWFIIAGTLACGQEIGQREIAGFWSYLT